MQQQQQLPMAPPSFPVLGGLNMTSCFQAQFSMQKPLLFGQASYRKPAKPAPQHLTRLCAGCKARQLPVVSRLLMIASDLAFRVRKSLQLCATLIVWTMQPEQTTDILPKLNCTATCLCHLCLPNSVATCLRPPGGSNDSRLPFQKVFVIIVRKN